MTNHKIDKGLIFLIISTLILFSVIFFYDNNKKYQYPEMNSEVYFDVYLPSYIPEGYSCHSMEIDDGFATLFFIDKNENRLRFVQMPAKNFTLSIDNQNHEITEFESSKYDGYHMHPLKTDYRTLVFWDKNNFFEISGQITEKQIIKMANSLSLVYSP